ncbi:DNA-directed RNA polymerase III subunit RPC8 [Rosa rugosa]|uniref:DNA-directed RNA polymerase III subunit RPC8 n=1 Tax=Rosa rugosa TaxID=74645 RepID=UPI002B414659|nr:DNA-directed RNA polymerase III subunit RPC8 [Rosa rugosa]
MFYRSRIEHSLRLPPSLLSLRLQDAVKGELEKLFLDKVISNLGLCISVYDIQSIKDHFILPNDGHPTLTVVFTLITFRPFVGEIITAKVIESTANGLRLSLGFFDDIYIPTHRFPTPCHKKDDSKKNVVLWYWKPSDDEFSIDMKDQIRFQVESVNYPKIPIEQPENSKPFAPMEVKGSIDFDGLGPVHWWQDVDEEAS